MSKNTKVTIALTKLSNIKLTLEIKTFCIKNVLFKKIKKRLEKYLKINFYLFMWINIYVAFYAFLAHIGPAVAGHPFALAFGALVLAEASFFSLIRRKAFAFGSSLQL